MKKKNYQTFPELVKYAESRGIKPFTLLNLYKNASKKFYAKEYQKGNEIPLNNQRKESKIIKICKEELDKKFQ